MILRRHPYIAIALVAALASGPYLWHEIDRSSPLEYIEAHFEKADVAPGQVITEAKPGEIVSLVLDIKWSRMNCSSEIERRFIDSDGVLHKVPRLSGEPQELGPPPANKLKPDGTIVSRRNILIPLDMPDGMATHDVITMHRCDWPAQTIGDYISRLWPITLGTKGAQAKIYIRK